MGARIRNVIPSTVVDSTNVYIRVNTWANGGAPYPFIRKDGIQQMLSGAKLTNSQFTAYSDSVEANISCAGGEDSCEVTASLRVDPSGIVISTLVPCSLTSVEIRSIDGSLEWSSSVPLNSNPSIVSLSPGLKIVLGKTNAAVVCTRKVLVQ
jgi:hypothetical protein